MMTDSPWVGVVFFAIAAYVFWMWRGDMLRQQQAGPDPRALAGAFPASRLLVLVAVLGALLIVALETAGEYALGTSASQSTIAASYLLAMVAAGFVEELVFRGYLFTERGGRAGLVASTVGFSVLFALLHTQYYVTHAEGAAWWDFSLKLEAGSLWTLSILVINSLWFYALRFMPWNPQRSLLPCIAAHVASNLAVFGVKAAQGHVVWG
jgi:uncharacterized protein